MKKNDDIEDVFNILITGSNLLIKKFLKKNNLRKKIFKMCNEIIIYNLNITEYLSNAIDTDKLNKNIISSIGGFSFKIIMWKGYAIK